MVNKIFSFAGFTVKFESEIPISSSSHFCNFTVSDKMPDMTVKVISCDKLPEKGTEIYNRGFSSLYDYNDDILEIGAEFFAELVKIRLPK